jgi:hypothetical protein
MTTLEQYDLCHPIFIEFFLFSFIWSSTINFYNIFMTFSIVKIQML